MGELGTSHAGFARTRLRLCLVGASSNSGSCASELRDSRPRLRIRRTMEPYHVCRQEGNMGVGGGDGGGGMSGSEGRGLWGLPGAWAGMRQAARRWWH